MWRARARARVRGAGCKKRRTGNSGTAYTQHTLTHTHPTSRARACVHLPQQHSEAEGVGAHGQVALKRLQARACMGVRACVRAAQAEQTNPVHATATGVTPSTRKEKTPAGLRARWPANPPKFLPRLSRDANKPTPSRPPLHLPSRPPHLGGHVRHGAPARDAGVAGHAVGGQPEVRHLGREAAAVGAAGHEQHVAGLEVAVHHPAGVQVAHALREGRLHS